MAGAASYIAARTQDAGPATYRDSFVALGDGDVVDEQLAGRLAAAAGMRNRLVHTYDDIDLDLVAAAVPGAIDDADAFVTQVSRWLDDV